MNAAQYNAVRKLLQCGHAYAKIEDYESALANALAELKKSRENAAGTDAITDGWYRACLIITELGFLVFGLEWQASQNRAYSEYAKS